MRVKTARNLLAVMLRRTEHPISHVTWPHHVIIIMSRLRWHCDLFSWERSNVGTWLHLWQSTDLKTAADSLLRTVFGNRFGIIATRVGTFVLPSNICPLRQLLSQISASWLTLLFNGLGLRLRFRVTVRWVSSFLTAHQHIIGHFSAILRLRAKTIP